MNFANQDPEPRGSKPLGFHTVPQSLLVSEEYLRRYRRGAGGYRSMDTREMEKRENHLQLRINQENEEEWSLSVNADFHQHPPSWTKVL